MKSNMTAHARFDRASRMEYILDTVGIGEVIAEIKVLDNQNRISYQKLTNTGVIIILAADNRTIVTTFIATTGQACAIYKTAKKVSRLPDGLYTRIRSNEKYMKNQPKW